MPRSPVVFSPTHGYPPLNVHFDAAASTSPNGIIVSYHWDFGDGTSDHGEYVEHIYTSASESGTSYPVTLTVTDEDGMQNSITKSVRVTGGCNCGG